MLTAVSLLALALAGRKAISALALAVIGASLRWYLVGYLVGGVALPRISIPPAATLRVGFVLLGMTALDALLRSDRYRRGILALTRPLRRSPT